MGRLYTLCSVLLLHTVRRVRRLKSLSKISCFIIEFREILYYTTHTHTYLLITFVCVCDMCWYILNREKNNPVPIVIFYFLLSYIFSTRISYAMVLLESYMNIFVYIRVYTIHTCSRADIVACVRIVVNSIVIWRMYI